MIYTKEKMAAIRAGIQKAGLSAPQEFFDAGIDELCEVCNGVGGSGLSNDSRLKLTRAFSFIEYSAAVHDWRYAKSDGTEEKRLEADKEFRANMLAQIGQSRLVHCLCRKRDKTGGIRRRNGGAKWVK